MNTKKFSEAMGEIDSKYVDRAMNYQPIKKVKKNNMKILTIRIVAVCATIVFMFFAAINIWAPVQARTIPFLGSAFAFVQVKLDFAGLYSNYAFEIGDTAADNGITVTMSEIYCDGTSLYVGFVVESEKSFSEISPDDYRSGQLYYEGTAYISDKSERKKLSDFGIAGLEGQFYDENTFVGIETFSLDGLAFPSEFEFEMKIDSIGIASDGMNVKTTNGKWIFSALAKSNTDDVVTYEINEEVNGHTIDKIVVTPVMITVYTSYPDLYSGTTRYEVKVFSDLSPDEDITKLGTYGSTTGITQIPRNRVDNILYIYVLDSDQLCKTGKERGAREEIEEHAIVWTEKVISAENHLETIVEEVNAEDNLDSIPFSVLADLSSLKVSQVKTTTISIVTEVIDWDYYVETENGKISNKLSTSFDYTRSSEDILKDTITIYFTDKETGKSYKYTFPLFFKNISDEGIRAFTNP